MRRNCSSDGCEQEAFSALRVQGEIQVPAVGRAIANCAMAEARAGAARAGARSKTGRAAGGEEGVGERRRQGKQPLREQGGTHGRVRA